MTRPPADVLVVGAGPAGSATAIRLARSGMRVVLVDRARFPRDKACAEYLSPDTLRLLARLGVLGEVDAGGGHRLTGLRVTAPHGSQLLGVFERAGIAPFRPTGLGISRRILDGILLDAARRAGVEVHERTTLEHLLEDGAGVGGGVVRSGGARHTLRARLTVGADGLRSRVARRIGSVRTGAPRRVAFVARVEDVAGIGAPGDPAEMHVGAGGYAGLNPLGGGVTNVAVVVPARRAPEAAGDAAGFMRRELRRYPAIQLRLAAGEPRRASVVGPFASRATRVVADGALLVGDAADFFDPFTGEGIWSALRGAELAAAAATDALTRSGAGPVPGSLLSGYRAARRRAFGGKWLVERLLGYAMWSPRLFDHAVARLARRGAMAHTLVGVTGRFVPARRVLDPRFLARMLV